MQLLLRGKAYSDPPLFSPFKIETHNPPIILLEYALVLPSIPLSLVLRYKVSYIPLLPVAPFRSHLRKHPWIGIIISPVSRDPIDIMSSLGATASDGDGRLVVVSGGGDDGVVDQQVTSIEQLTASLQREKLAKRKMYGYLVKIADELKALRNESEQLIHAAEYAQRAWHEGGMWRGPNVLPDAASSGLHNNSGGGGGGGSAAGAGAGSTGPALVPRAPLSLTDLFVDIVSE